MPAYEDADAVFGDFDPTPSVRHLVGCYAAVQVTKFDPNFTIGEDAKPTVWFTAYLTRAGGAPILFGGNASRGPSAAPDHLEIGTPCIFEDIMSSNQLVVRALSGAAGRPVLKLGIFGQSEVGRNPYRFDPIGTVDPKTGQKVLTAAEQSAIAQLTEMVQSHSAGTWVQPEVRDLSSPPTPPAAVVVAPAASPPAPTAPTAPAAPARPAAIPESLWATMDLAAQRAVAESMTVPPGIDPGMWAAAGPDMRRQLAADSAGQL